MSTHNAICMFIHNTMHMSIPVSTHSGLSFDTTEPLEGKCEPDTYLQSNTQCAVKCAPGLSWKTGSSALYHHYISHNYMGHNYTGHNYVGHDHIGHNYIGHDYIGHNYIGHDYIGHDYMGQVCVGSFVEDQLIRPVYIAVPHWAWHSYDVWLSIIICQRRRAVAAKPFYRGILFLCKSSCHNF